MSLIMSLAIFIFIACYVVIVSEKVNKTVVVLLGACIFVIFQFIPFEEAVHHIDLNVVLLLIGMMIIVKISEESGLYEWIAVWGAKKVKADPGKILVLLFLITAVFSAFLDNVTTILLISPVTLLLATQLNISPLPFLLSEIIASNIGGTATLIGDPPNIMIGSAADLSFLDFLKVLSPLIVIQLIVFAIIFLLLFRKKLVVSPDSKMAVMKVDEKKLITNKPLLIKSLIVLFAVITGFIFHGIIHVEASVIALAGAAILMVWTKSNVEHILEKVEWTTILFFVGLFMMVGALDYTGFIKKIAEILMDKTQGNIETTSSYLLFFTGGVSGILDNIPLVATFIPIIKVMGVSAGAATIKPLWWSLSLGACLGGNATLIGASANVIMMNFAKRNHVKLSFKGYMAYGIPATLLSLVMSFIYLKIIFF